MEPPLRHLSQPPISKDNQTLFYAITVSKPANGASSENSLTFLSPRARSYYVLNVS